MIRLSIPTAALLLHLLALSYSVPAAVTVSASAERTRLAVGEQLVVNLAVASDRRLEDIPVPSLPASPYYKLLRTTRNQSGFTSSIQIINGKVTKKTEITYYIHYHLNLLKEGNFTFPALELQLEGTTYRTKPFPVTVTREPVRNPPVQLRMLVNNTSPYVGEQMIATLRVAKKAGSPAQLTQQGFVDCLDRLESEISRSFSVNRLFSRLPDGEPKRIGGEMYHVFEARYALFPLRSGKQKIESIPMEYVVQRRERSKRRDPFFGDFFDEGFFGFERTRNIPRTTASSAVSVTVRPLPPSPADYSGGVGTFSLEASAAPQTIPAGEAVTLKITVRGSTRPGSMGDITLPELRDFEVFTPEKHTYVDTSAAGLSTRKNWKYLLIPGREGPAEIPPITLVYFDPAAEEYRSTSSDPIPLTVTEGKGVDRDPARYLTQGEIREVGRDIRYIKTVTSLRSQPEAPYKRPLLLLLYPLPFLFAVFSALYRIQSRRPRDEAALRRQKAVREAMKEIDKVRKERSALSASQVIDRMAPIIERYISHKFSFPATGKTLGELRDELTTRGVDEEIVAKLVAFIETMDRYRFGGAAVDEQAKDDVLQQTVSFVRSLAGTGKKGGRA